MTIQTETIPQGKSTEVKPQAAVKPETQTPKEKTIGQKLFSDMAGRGIPGTAFLEPEPKKPEPKPEATVKEEPKPEPKPEKKYLNLEDFKGGVVKLKVDGVEEEAQLEDIIRRVQIDKHLTNKGQKLSEEEKRVRAREAALEEREKVLTEMMSLASKQDPKASESTPDSIFKDDPYVKRMEEQMEKIRKDYETLRAQTQPILYREAIDRVDNYVKTELQLDDFRQYTGKIKEALLNLPTEQQQAFDNESGWLTIYKDMKFKETMEKLKGLEKAPPKPPEERPPSPPVPPIESGKSTSSASIVDDESAKAKELLERAKRLALEGSKDERRAWEEYFAYQRSIRGKE